MLIAPAAVAASLTTIHSLPARADVLLDNTCFQQTAHMTEEAQTEICARLIHDPTQSEHVKTIAYYWSGFHNAHMRQLDKAIADYSAAIALDKSMAAAYYGRAKALEYLSRYDLAVRDFDKLTTLEPSSAPVLSEACWARALWGQELDIGLKDCNGALEIMHDDAGTLNARALIEYRRGDYAASVADNSAALAKRPAMSDALYMRGLAKAKTGDKPGADADIAAAKETAPKIEELYASYGVMP
jgi:tetratricopeptide (TPR) repeat protein